MRRISLLMSKTRKTGPGSSTPPEDGGSFSALWRRAAAPFALHYAVAVCVLAAAALGVSHQVKVAEWTPVPPMPALAETADHVIDAGGAAVPCRRYQRIVLCNGAGLVERLTRTERIAAVNVSDAGNRARAWAFADIARVNGILDVEAILAVHPDLVVAQLRNVAEGRAAARLRSAGCPVFDPGEVLSLAGLEKSYLALGTLLQARERAQLVVEELQRRARLLALHAPASQPVRLRGAGSAPAATARLHSALELAGLSLAEPGTVAGQQLTLSGGALEDPLGSDLLEVATSLRVQLASQQRTP